MSIGLLLLLQVSVTPPPAGTPRPTLEAQALAFAHTAADTFAGRWRDAWQRNKSFSGIPVSRDRSLLLHCHADVPTAQRYSGGNDSDDYWRIAPFVIRAGVGKFAMCPSWYFRGPTLPRDERRSLDESLAAHIRDQVRIARARLLADLDVAATVVPDDDWLEGQRLRFALDQGDTARARAATAGCRADNAWCLLLRGYLESEHRKIAVADSLFAQALRAMSPADRCAWSDLGPLLDPEGRAAYAGIPCAARDSINERIWWLTDPLFSEPGNERRVEHYARLMLVRLRSGTSVNEHWDMRDEGGGAAVREMLIRYGWPSVSVWGGPTDDRGHFDYLGILGNESMMDHGRFATAEYFAPRVHTVPSWSAITDPFTTRGAEWVLTLQAFQVQRNATAQAGALPNPATQVVSLADTLWWPEEHYDRTAGPVVQLRHQSGFFRRDTTVLFAMSADLAPAYFGGVVGDTLRGALVLSTGPSDLRAEPRGGLVGYVATFRAMLPGVRPPPQLVSLELYGAHPAGVVARDRFGIAPPPPLAAMADGELGVSSLVLLHPTEQSEMLPNDPDAALRRMFGSTVLQRPTSIGVYWETYGISSGDSVDVSIDLQRHGTRPGVLRRIGMALGLARGNESGVSIQWREPQSSHVVATIPGRIPVQGRSITLNLGQIAAGDYTLTVAMKRPTGATVRSTRDIRVVR